MEKKLMIEIVVILAIITGAAIAWKKGKKKEIIFLATSILTSLMEEAEEYIGSKKGKEKLNRVLEKYEIFIGTLSPITQFLFKTFLSKNKIKEIVENIIPYINEKFELKDKFEKEGIKSIVNEVANNLLNKAINTNYNGDSNLISNSQLIDLGNEISLNEEDKGYIQAFAQIKSDLKKEHELIAGVKAGMKF